MLSRNEALLVTMPLLLRDIAGNPFRSVAASPDWLSWNDGAIPKLAQGIYTDRAFDRLPILADALQEAGCYDEHILSHCRRARPTEIDSWVVYLLVGRDRNFAEPPSKPTDLNEYEDTGTV